MLVVYQEGQMRSGRLGATIASRNRSGNYLRAGTKPINPNTERQSIVRVAQAGLVVAWSQTLTQAQRDAWALWASNMPTQNRLGQSMNITGQNAYIRANVSRLQSGLARVDDGPTIFEDAAPEQSLVGSGSEATQQLSVAYDDEHDWCDEDGAGQLLYMGAPQNQSVNFFGGPYRFVGVIEGNSTTPPTSPAASLDVPDWPIAEDQAIWLRTRISRADGRLSSFAISRFLCLA